MGLYKWFLLNVAISCYALDTLVTLVGLPLVPYPVIGLCVNGLGALFLPHGRNYAAYGSLVVRKTTTGGKA